MGIYKLITSVVPVPPVWYSTYTSHCLEQRVGWERQNRITSLKQVMPFYILEQMQTSSCSIKWLKSMAELINLSFFPFSLLPKYLSHMCFHQVYRTHWSLVRKDSHEHAWPCSTVHRQHEERESERGSAFTHPCSARVNLCRINCPVETLEKRGHQTRVAKSCVLKKGYLSMQLSRAFKY